MCKSYFVKKTVMHYTYFGVILQKINLLAEILCYNMLLVNNLASHVATHYGFDVLDFHHAMSNTFRNICHTEITETQLLVRRSLICYCLTRVAWHHAGL